MWDFTHTCNPTISPFTCESLPLCEFQDLSMGHEQVLLSGKGGDVFMVPTQRGQRKPKWPTHKDPGEKRKKRKAQQRNIANGAK